MAKDKIPVTPAVRELRKHKVPFTPHYYEYVEHGGTNVAASSLELDETMVIKTLIMEDQDKKPLVVLMNGNASVSTKNLARTIGAKSVQPCSPKVAQSHSGYMVGGTSPFGTKKKMPVYMEESIANLSPIYINGGKRGFLVEINPQYLVELLKPQLVNVAT